jgi:hypothetical protein
VGDPVALSSDMRGSLPPHVAEPCAAVLLSSCASLLWSAVQQLFFTSASRVCLANTLPRRRGHVSRSDEFWMYLVFQHDIICLCTRSKHSRAA